MTNGAHRTLVLFTALLLAGGTVAAHAGSQRDDHKPQAGNQRQDSGGKSRAAAKARAQYGGKVLSVSEVNSGGRTRYKVKLLLDSGRVTIVTIDD